MKSIILFSIDLDMVRRTGTYNVSKQSISEKVSPGPATFEEAISATGFGKFNYLLMVLGVLPSNWAQMICMSSVGQIIPSLKCYFDLNLLHIGLLHSSPFLGNILSTFLWGYAADSMGRRKLMIYTTLADAICVVICAFSTNFEMIISFKLLSGFLISAPTGIIISYLAECHSAKYRSTIILCSGLCYGSASLVLPLMAWAILPQEFYYIHSWQLFLLMCSIPSLVTSISFIGFPESPKFLMSKGKHDEALIVFKKIYSMNTNKPGNSYPIISLLYSSQETKIVVKDVKNIYCQIIYNGWNQFKPILSYPYLYRLILSMSVQLFLMMGVNTLRIWLPDIITLMDQYHSNKNNTTPATMCHIITESINNTNVENISNMALIEQSCSMLQSHSEVYIKLSVIGACSIFMFIIVTIAVELINKKIILGLLLLISGFSGILLIWCTNPIIISLISTLYTTQSGVAHVTFMSIIVDLFPTSFRTMAIMIIVTAGRIGSMLGNIIFPILLEAGCVPPFCFLGMSVLVCIIPLTLMSSAKEQDL